jgi:hypothetical protein
LTHGRGGTILVGSRHATEGRPGRNQLLEPEVRTVRSFILRGIIALVVTSFTYLWPNVQREGFVLDGKREHAYIRIRGQDS